MEEIKEIFKDKNFNEETLGLIDNFIKEFDELFGEYVPKEELIKRIRENLNENIGFTKFEKGQVLGRYNCKDKNILLQENMPEDKLKAVFFHEMVHCITNRGEYVGFTSEIDLGAKTARGITEGFTQYVSKIRNQKYGITLNSYPILTEQTENLASLLGEKDFLDVAFNDPEKLFGLMEEKGLVDSYIDAEEFCDYFDVIWQYEDEIYEGKVIAGTAVGKLMKAIFGKIDNGNKDVKDAKSQIINTFLGRLKEKEFTTKEDFEDLYGKIQKYSEQLDLEDDYNSFKLFFDKIKELEESGKTREEILTLVPEDTVWLVEKDFEFRDFIELEPEEMLKQIVDPENKIYEKILYGYFEKYYSARIAQKIFKGAADEDVLSKLMSELQDGLGTYIIENGLNMDLLSIEVIELERASGLTFNLYEATGDDFKYLSTLSSANEDGTLEELKVCSEEEKQKLLKEHPDLSEDGVILVGASGSILEYNGNNDYIFIDEYENVYENFEEVSYHESYAEELYRRIKESAKRYSMLQKHNIKPILEKEADLMKKLQEEHKAITGRGGFTPEDVENATKEVTLEDVQQVLDEMTGPKITREETFEKGIGYDE